MAITPQELLRVWLSRRLSVAQNDWLESQLSKMITDPSLRSLQITFGMVPRRLGKDDLTLEPGDLAAARQARAGWDPSTWSIVVAARVLVLVVAGDNGNNFADKFSNLCRYADVAEAVALYSGLPLYPEQQLLEPQVGEGLRTNMRSVFEAIAHRNPYPCEQLDENRWNHMVLKALFVDSTLYPIQGLDERANPELARILRDYAHERWSASRSVTPELWRCIGPFADDSTLDDLERVIRDGDSNEQKGAALALAASPAVHAKELLQQIPDLAASIEIEQLTWDALAKGH